MNLEADVRKLYESKNPQRTEWADWLFNDHIFIVAKNSELLAERLGANKEYSRAAAMLHDIADATMSRFDDKHEEESLSISRYLLGKNGFDSQEISLIVDDAIKYHSCIDGQIPKSMEGKVLAAADSIAHLQTTFYQTATKAMQGKKTPEQIRDWVLKKLDRDYFDKILFEDIRSEVEIDYTRLKNEYSQ